MPRYVSRRLMVGAAMLTWGCGSDGKTNSQTAPQGEELEIFSWWLAPGEAGALEGIIDLYESRHPGSDVINAVSADGDSSRATLAERLEQGVPPDLYQENARQLRTVASAHRGKLTELDDFVAEHELEAVLVPELLDDVTVDGSVLALPMGIHRANSLFYNKALFTQHELEPPSTLAELLLACETLKRAGVVPIAISHQGWVHNLLFELLHQSVLGTQRYQAFLEGDPGDDEAKLEQAIALYAEVLANYTNADAGDDGFDWSEAANLVFEGKAAMYAHGDWAKGLFVQRGWVSDVDFGVVGAPGASDLFVYDLDVWVMPKGGPNPQGALDFLEAAVSVEGQLAFDLIKGATSVRTDLPLDRLDSIGRSVSKSFEQASVRTMSPLPDMSALYEAFIVDRDQEALLRGMLDAYEGLRSVR